MSLSLALLALGMAIIGLAETLAIKNAFLTRIRWYTRATGAALVLVSAVLGVVRSCQPSIEETRLIRVECKMDQLYALLDERTKAPASDTSLERRIREQAQCLRDIVSSALDKGIVAFASNQYEQAETHLLYAVKAANRDSVQLGRAYHVLGQVKRSEGRDDLALEYFDHAARIVPKEPLILLDYGTGLFMYGMTLKDTVMLLHAVAVYDSVLQLDRTVCLAWSNAASILRHLGRFTKALSLYDSAIAACPILFAGYSGRGQTLLNLDRVAEAITSFSRAIELFPNDQVAYYGRGTAKLRQDKWYEAIIDLALATFLDSTDFDAWMNLGAAQGRGGDPLHAIRSFHRAHLLKPRDPGVLRNLGICMYQQQFLDSAFLFLDSAIKFGGDAGEIARIAAGIRKGMTIDIVGR